MLNRRRFIKNSSALAFGGMLLPNQIKSLLGRTSAQPVGVQLFTAMSIIDKDLNGTLQKIASIGYQELESAFSMKGGYYGLKPKEFADLAKSFGLSWKSHHVLGAPFKMPAGGAGGGQFAKTAIPKLPPMKTLLTDHQQLVDEAAEGGVEYLVCASTPIKTLDEIKTSMEVLQKTGEACKKAGIVFAYHNHSAEFEKVEGQIPYDLFTSQISSDILKFELDLAWVIKAGINPVDLFKKHPGRFPLWHVKDLSKGTNIPVEIGTGYLDFKPIFENASTSGMKHFFVEQDGAPSPLENITTSFNNLKKIIG